ncbi:RsfA family transcriptional regulator [Lentibacillus saliphilus]|uniref:RsfA family transcriptional regulator n=1 Tax=Lentibacillus saliphilus TaxID=2737028 RepID=UPI001C2FF5B7|nr:RsfA family transcriptional regulator [Lentibacillus saliphilus]
MAKVRQDAWSHEDDLLLAETVLRHIREGSTQLKAFEEVGDHLNRTSAACGFRWNAEVRNKYISAIDLAKRQRKEKKRRLAKAQVGVKDFTSGQPDTASDTRKLTAVTKQDTDYDTSVIEQSADDINLDNVIHFLVGLKKDYNAANQATSRVERLQSENQDLQDTVSRLEKELKEAQQELNTIKEDYHVFMQIMDRARKMTVFEDQGALKAPAFKMDKNGNLEQIAQSSGQ